jgi:hypothetical protein
MKLSFPFSHKSVFRLSTEGVNMALIEAEEAVSKEEVQQALSGRTILHFRQPLLLHFPDPQTPLPIYFRFSFDVEILVVAMNGVVENAYPIPAFKNGDVLNVQFFSGYDYAILVPKGFIQNWQVVPGKTSVRRFSLSSAGKRTA